MDGYKRDSRFGYRSHSARMLPWLRPARVEVLAPYLMVRLPWDFPFNIGNYAATHHRLVGSAALGRSHNHSPTDEPFCISIQLENVASMQIESVHFPATPIALKMAVSIGIGMLVGMEREWSNKDVGVRSFAIVALLGMLVSLMV